MTLSGLAEGFGVLTLLPLLSFADENGVAEAQQAPIDLLNSLNVRPTLGLLIGIVILGLALKGLLLLTAVRQAGYLGSDIAEDLRLRIIRALTRADWSYFTSKPVGEITNAVGTETIRASQVATEGGYLLAAITQVTVYGGLALLVSWQLTLGAGLFGATLFLALKGVVAMARTGAAEEAEILRSINSRLSDELAAIKPLKAMGREASLEPVLVADAKRLNRAQRTVALSRALLPSLQEPFLALVLGAGLYFSLTYSDAKLEELLFLALIFYRIATRLGNAQTYIQSLQTLKPSYWAVQTTIEQAEAAQEMATGSIAPTLTDKIHLHNVSFGYGRSKPIISNIDIEISAGKMTTITGASGVGKTTLLDLIVGLIQPDEGSVLVDGHSLSTIDSKAWRSRIGYVPQDTVLVHQSIYLNLVAGDLSISEVRAMSALKKAGISDFVAALPDGLDTPVGERGSQLSGGQRQRLAIARALLRDPLLLILDEATSSLDPETEREICRTLQELRGPLTIIAVTHQEALQAIADHTIRLEH